MLDVKNRMVFAGSTDDNKLVVTCNLFGHNIHTNEFEIMTENADSTQTIIVTLSGDEFVDFVRELNALAATVQNRR